MYNIKGADENWSRAYKEDILKELNYYKDKSNKLSDELADVDSLKAKLRYAKEQLDAQMQQYRTLKLSEDNNLLLDAYDEYRKDCDAQLKQIDESVDGITSRYKNINLVSISVVSVILCIILLIVNAQKNGYMDEVTELKTQITQLTENDNTAQANISKLQSELDQSKVSLSKCNSEKSSCNVNLSNCEQTVSTCKSHRNINR